MAEVIDLKQSHDALAFAAEFVGGRFKDVVDAPGGGWTALCPCCDADTRITITRELTFDGCPNGHTTSQIVDATSPPVPSQWGFQTAAAFLACEFPPPRWLYLDLVPAESVTVVMAAPNAGKTFFALDVVAQVAVRAAAQGTTVWIVEEEGTAAALQWRLSRALASVGVDIRHEAAARIHIAWNTGRSIRNKEHLASLAKECAGAELVMLDSLSALAGGIDENSSQDMAEVAEALNLLKVSTHAAIMPLHHMTKAAWKEGETPRLEHMRGHGALPGRADAVLALVPLESDEERVNFELHCVKQRDGSKPKARLFTIAMKGTAAICTIEAKDDSPVGRKASAVESDTLSRIPVIAPGVSKTFLESIVKGHRAQEVRRAVDRLVDALRVVQLPSGRYIQSQSAPSGRTGTGSDGPARPDPSPPFRVGRGSGNPSGTRDDL